MKKRQAVSMKGSKEEEEGNELILRLRRQSEENKERNDNEVRVKTLMNDQVREKFVMCCIVILIGIWHNEFITSLPLFWIHHIF